MIWECTRCYKFNWWLQKRCTNCGKTNKEQTMQQLPKQTTCPQCGHTEATIVCHICKFDKLDEQIRLSKLLVNTPSQIVDFGFGHQVFFGGRLLATTFKTERAAQAYLAGLTTNKWSPV